MTSTGVRWWANGMLVGALLSYVITLSLGISSVVGTMLIGVLPATVAHWWASWRDGAS